MNYKKIGCVYKIRNSIDGQIYIGSTKKRLLCQRMAQHRYKARHLKNSKLYKLMREYGIDKFKIEKICDIHAPEYKKNILREHEKICMKLYKPSLNQFSALQTKEERKKYKQEYRMKNEEKIKKYEQERYKTYKIKRLKQYPCECGQIVSDMNLIRHKKSKRHKNFIAGNDKYPRMKCECGATIDKRPCRIKKHLLTKKHLKLLALNA